VNRVIIDLDVLRHNMSVIGQWMKKYGATWTIVTKVLCGHRETIKALLALGVQSIGDSRLENLKMIKNPEGEFEVWYLRVPDLSSVKDVVSYSHISLNSEIETIKAINAEAMAQGKIHRIVIMIELGDLREGILPGTLVNFYDEIFRLENINVIGIGTNLGCLSGIVPTVDQFTQLVLYRELLELKFGRMLPLVSAGSTAVLPVLLSGQLPKAINHFRVGEAVFLGTDLLNGGTLPGLRNDAITVEAEIAEIKEKGLVPLGEAGVTSPFDNESPEETVPGQRGYRALVSIGELDTDVSGLTPINPEYSIAGASSDLLVVNVGDEKGSLRMGDTISFRVNYAALLRLMSSRYVTRVITPSLQNFTDDVEEQDVTVAEGTGSLKTVNADEES